MKIDVFDTVVAVICVINAVMTGIGISNPSVLETTLMWSTLAIFCFRDALNEK